MLAIIIKGEYSIVKVSKEQVEQNRQRVIDTAAMLFRERGLDGIGIADLMEAAGLTHGGFYRQFKCKDDLVVQAIKRAFEETSADLAQQLSQTDTPLETLVRYYVSDHHRDDPGHGCSLTALATDAARCDDPDLRSFFGIIVRKYIELLTTLVPGKDQTAKRSAAIALLAEMVGSVILSRVVPDLTVSTEILEIVSKDLIERHRASAAA
jgi:TetR/AcrR family transcriptional regulator, transcriptional repressor for nem operon